MITWDFLYSTDTPPFHDNFKSANRLSHILHSHKLDFRCFHGDISHNFPFFYTGFAFVESAWQCWALFIIYGTYFGLTEGVEKAFVADMVPARKRGTAYGFYNLAYGITVFPASILFGLVWDQYGATSAFLISAATSVAAIAFFATVRSPKVSHQ